MKQFKVARTVKTSSNEMEGVEATRAGAERMRPKSLSTTERRANAVQRFVGISTPRDGWSSDTYDVQDACG